MKNDKFIEWRWYRGFSPFVSELVFFSAFLPEILSNLVLRIEGNIWDLDFKLLDDRDQLVAEISKQVFTLTSTYEVTVYEEEYADLVISLCLAIDYVEMTENGS